MSILQKTFPATYKNFSSKIKFVNAKNMNFKGLKLEFAKTKHSLPNMAIKITEGKNSFSYSGDGMYTNSTKKMYKGSNLIIQLAKQKKADVFIPEPMQQIKL